MYLCHQGGPGTLQKYRIPFLHLQSIHQFNIQKKKEEHPLDDKAYFIANTTATAKPAVFCTNIM